MLKIRNIILYFISPFFRIFNKLKVNKKQSFCRLYDSIFERIEEGNVWISVPEFRGSFYIDIRSHILQRLVLEENYEPELIELAIQNISPQKDIIDVGANIGLFTVLFSKLISKDQRVLAIEPTSSAFNYLNMNISKNHVKNSVITFNGIASNKKGVFQLNTIPGKEEYSSVGMKLVHPAIANQKFKTVEVAGDTIDNLVITNQMTPGFIKIDVEGYEYSAIEGAKNTLIKFKPVIMTELDDRLLSNCGHTSEEVISLIESIGYNVFDVSKMSKPNYPFCGDILALPNFKSNIH